MAQKKGITYIRTVLLSNKSRKGLYHYFNVNGKSRYYKANNIPQEELLTFLQQQDTKQTTQTTRSFLAQYGKPKTSLSQPKDRSKKLLTSQKRRIVSSLPTGIFTQEYTVQQLLTQPHTIIQNLLQLQQLSKTQLQQIMNKIKSHTSYTVLIKGTPLEMKGKTLKPVAYSTLGQLFYHGITPLQFKTQYGMKLLSVQQQKPVGYLRDLIQSVIRQNNFKSYFPNQVQVHDVSIKLEIKL